jgi:hypothetical protein
MTRLRWAHVIPLAAVALGGGLMAVPASAATSGTFTVTGGMSAASDLNTATVLPDGEVLVIGDGTTSAELYNPATGKWAPTGAMSAARFEQTATLLPDGNVLATAGIGGAAGPFAESYNPATGQWSPAIGGSLPLACMAAQDCRLGSTATLLGDGDVLVAGGLTGTTSNGHSSSALLYNPAAGTWTATGALNTPRIDQTASLLPNGQVLVAGGENFASHKLTLLASAELYTP